MILVGDCVELMAAMPDASVDAVVTDPPYGLEFMGKEWDRLQAPGRDDLRHRRRMDVAPDPEQGNPWASERKSYGTVKKNPRCKRCGRLRFDHEPRRCACDQPDWDLRIAESARVMQDWHYRWASEALRVLKPGGHLLAFGGTRTYHRLACAIEDAGFEIRDCLSWLYGSGFPKSLDVSKAIDKAAGAEREVVAEIPDRWTGKGQAYNRNGRDVENGLATGDPVSVTGEPATPEAQRWQGWGTALKPAHEPIVVARKPLAGTVAGNVLATGCGALNVDGCRIPTDDPLGGGTFGGVFGNGKPAPDEGSPLGRWPANVVLDEEAAAMLDEQTGELTTGAWNGDRSTPRMGANGIYGAASAAPGYGVRVADSGGASRFFYVAKASRAERNAGLEGFEERQRPGAFDDDGYEWKNPGGHVVAKPTRNHHPTVKPIALMRWLVRLVTPPGGLVLDPFAGSGTTGIACALEGFEFTGCEQDADYARIAEARIAWWTEHGEDALRIVAERERAEAEREQVAASGQLDIFASEGAA